MATRSNNSWNLSTFLDALIYELDRAQDTLSIKGANRKLTYMVRDMALDLQLFPEYHSGHIQFTTAKPGEAGASKMTLQLGSIREHQIQEVTQPISQDDIAIEATDLPETAHKTLKKLGIRSTEDLRRAVDDQGIDLNAYTEEKIDRQTLDQLLNQARRRQNPPLVSKAKFTKIYNENVLILKGENLMIFTGEGEFPVAVLDGKRVPVIAAGENQIDLKIDRAQLENQPGKLEVALDHYAVINLTLKTNLNAKSALQEHDPRDFRF
ncbi:MAG: hypothetical protein F6K47_07755 [Symploca sp. SIO2E6]|nr:hypothetical protein [Symploca sp. SIO2E6]